MGSLGACPQPTCNIPPRVQAWNVLSCQNMVIKASIHIQTPQSETVQGTDMVLQMENSSPQVIDQFR